MQMEIVTQAAGEIATEAVEVKQTQGIMDQAEAGIKLEMPAHQAAGEIATEAAEATITGLAQLVVIHKAVEATTADPAQQVALLR